MYLCSQIILYYNSGLYQGNQRAIPNRKRTRTRLPPELQQLLGDMLPKFVVTNEPARVECGAPDFIISTRKDNLPVFFIEAKDIDDTDLDGRREHREQFNRYRRRESDEKLLDQRAPQRPDDPLLRGLPLGFQPQGTQGERRNGLYIKQFVHRRHNSP